MEKYSEYLECLKPFELFLLSYLPKGSEFILPLGNTIKYFNRYFWWLGIKNLYRLYTIEEPEIATEYNGLILYRYKLQYLLKELYWFNIKIWTYEKVN